MLPPDFTSHSRYHVIYALDERPESTVYRARDEQTGRYVLLAALPLTGDAHDEIQQRAHQIAAMRHELLLPLTDHFADGAAYYLACDDPGGQDLERALRARGGPLLESDVLPQFARLLGCLETLHSQRPPLYLGDPLPSDVWIGGYGKWSLAPFTLVRPIGHALSPYRAPELADQQAKPDSASDLYAVGALLYHALTGWALPAQQTGTPSTSPRSLNPAISAQTEQVILRALQPRSGNRYQAARDMRLALETVQTMGGRTPRTGTDVLPAAPDAAPRAGLTATPSTPAAADLAAPPYPPGIYPAPEPAPLSGRYTLELEPAAPAGIYPAPQRQRGLSTGCLVAIAIVLTLLAVAVCIALLLLVPGSPIRDLFIGRSNLPVAGTWATINILHPLSSIMRI